MARVSTTISYVEVEGDFGFVEGVEVTCDKCGHSEKSGGTEDPSLRRCAFLLKENCPWGENNYYDVSE